MAKGEIIQHLGDAKYRVSLKYGVERIQRELIEIDTRIAELAVLVPDAKVAAIGAESAVKAKASEIDALIPDYRDGVEGSLKAIKDLQVELIRLQRTAQLAVYSKNQLIAEDLSLKKRRGQIDRQPEDKVIDAWCADLVTDISGLVGLVDVNDEGGGPVIIQPAFNGEGVYSPDRDGQLVARGAQYGAQLYFNAAVLPGIQKWFPRYRVGSITSIGNDVCTVLLDPAISSAQSLDINEVSVLSDIPVQYMDCDLAAFVEGDRVLVRWFDTGPQVIGFEANPKPCAEAGFYFMPTQGTSLNGYITYGTPFFDSEGAAINPPLGTNSGQGQCWSAVPAYRDEPYTITKGLSQYLAGDRNWMGATNDLIVSWEGPPSRFYEHETEVNKTIAYHLAWYTDTKIYYKLETFVNLSQVQEALPFVYVEGAALKNEESGLKLYVIATDANAMGASHRLLVFSVESDKTVIAAPTIGPTLDLPENLRNVSGWYFNRSCTKAVMTARSYNTQVVPDPDRTSVYLYHWNQATGFSSELIYDAGDGDSGSRTDTKYESLTKSSGVGLSYDYYRVDTLPGSGVEIDIPIYADYVGDNLEIAYHRLPAYTQSNTNEWVQKFYTMEYPHPCAGQPNGRGGTYPATFTWNNAKQTHSISKSKQVVSSGPESIVTSVGAVLASLPFSDSSSVDSNTDSSQENASETAPCGTFEISENSYEANYSRSDVRRAQGPQFDEFTIDLRSGFVVIGYEKYSENRVSSRTGTVVFDDTVEIDTFNRYIELNTVTGTVSTEKTLDIWLGGLKQHSHVVSQETQPLGETHTVSGDRVLVPLNDLGSQLSGAGTIDETTGPTTITFGKDQATVMLTGYRLGDCAAVNINNRTAISVIFISNLYPLWSYQRLEGIGNVVDGLFERGPDETYTMHRLTVF